MGSDLKYRSTGVYLAGAEAYAVEVGLSGDSLGYDVVWQEKGPLEEIGFARGVPITSVANGVDVIKNIKTPPVEKRKLDTIVRYEARMNIPFPLERTTWGYVISREENRGEGFGNYAVRIGALENELFEGQKKAFDGVGVKLDRVTLNSEALSTLRPCDAYLHVEDGFSELILPTGDGTYWCRRIPTSDPDEIPNEVNRSMGYFGSISRHSEEKLHLFYDGLDESAANLVSKNSWDFISGEERFSFPGLESEEVGFNKALGAALVGLDLDKKISFGFQGKPWWNFW